MSCLTPAIVCDADILSAISTIQTLGKRGVPVLAISSKKEAIGFSSRYVTQAFHSEVCNGAPEFADYLIANIPPGVIICGSDGNAEVISQNKTKLLEHGFLFTIPDFDTLLTLYDKHELHLYCERIGVRTPKSNLLSSVEDLRKNLKRSTQPQILKPTKGAGGHYYRLGDDVDPVETYLRLSAEISSPDYEHQSSKIMLQDYVDFKGDLWNYNALYRDGEFIAGFSGLRLRTPIKRDGSLQSSLLHGVSQENDKLSALNHKLFNAIGYSGLVETEWLVDSLNGSYVLFDVNPRLSGNIRWAIKGGVDLPYQYYLLTTGQVAGHDVRQREGVTYHKMFWNKTDLFEAFRGRSSSRESLWGVLASNLGALLSPSRSAVDILDYHDLKPTLKIISKMLARFLGRFSVRMKV